MLATIFTWVATAVALAGTVLNCKQIRACFYLWTITNTMWLIWDTYSGLYSRAILDTAQLGLAIWGIYSWKKIENDRAKDADTSSEGQERKVCQADGKASGTGETKAD